MTVRSDLDALLGAVLEDPFDDTPRLIYADWLEEHAGSVPCDRCKGIGHLPWDDRDRFDKTCAKCDGDKVISNGNAERAEFIHVQIELAKYETEWKTLTGLGAASEELRIRVEYLRRRERDIAGLVPMGLWFNPEPDNRNWHYFVAGNEPKVSVTFPYLVVARGWPSAVSCTLAAFMGGELCPRCGHTAIRGEVCTDDGVDQHGHRRASVKPCPVCEGDRDYRTPGLAPQLFSVAPFTTVTLSDREPVESLTGWWWSSTRTVGNYPQSILPDDLFARLPGISHGTNLSPSFPAADAALLALSRAATNYGRSKAAGHTHEVPCESCDGDGAHRHLTVLGSGKTIREGTNQPCRHCSGKGTVTRPGLPPLWKEN